MITSENNLIFEQKKKQYLDRIDLIAKESFNNEQKEVAKQIIESANENNIDAVYQLVTQRVKTGFVFDSAPEVNHNCVALVSENSSLTIKSNEAFNNEHTMIIGENYDALKNLLATYVDPLTGEGLIDIIYIDPPYNTESAKKDGNDYKEEVEAAKFVYRDKYTRDGWLNMMNERLKLARKLLSNRGIIYISIDDGEQSYLKVLCDEIFGEKNFISNLIWKCRSSLYYTEPLISIQTEYILAYAKDKTQFSLKSFDKENIDGDEKALEGFYFNRVKKLYDDEDYSNNDNDPRGPYKTSGKVRNDGRPVYTVTSPTGVKHTEAWVYSPEVFQRLIDDNQIYWGVDGSAQPRKKSYFKDYIGKVSSNLLYDEFVIVKNNDKTKKVKIFEVGTTESGTKELKDIVGENKFPYPKPVELIKYLVGLYPTKDCRVLDFFAGSGTTGQSVMELNEEDGGTRKFILVTNNENNIAIDVTLERLYRVIHGKGSKNEKIIWKYSDSKPSLTNNSLNVFEIVYHELKLNDFDKANKLIPIAEQAFKKLNSNYRAKDRFDIYNELAALNPYKKV